MTKSARIAVIDLNGQLRGKRVPEHALQKTTRLPLSVQNVDIFGADIEGSPLIFETGDQDGILEPIGDPVALPWLTGQPRLQLAMMSRESGQPFAGDPRRALIAALDRMTALGLSPIASVELEFFLVENGGNLAAPRNPKTKRRMQGTEIASLRELDAFEAFFNDIEHGAREMALPDHTVSSEAALGQFEITLAHQPALQAADSAVLMKELIKGTALAHGFIAVFQAKPFVQESGSGLHVHCSMLTPDGSNAFDDGTEHGTPLLRHAIAGCLEALSASTLIFAPHLQSYRRFVEHAHAPTTASWGYENRTVALRVPGGPAAARRLEHRVAGADANPYLLFAALLGAAANGIEDRRSPGAPVTGNAYGVGAKTAIAPDMLTAIDQLSDPVMARIFPPLLLDNLGRTKRQEQAKCAPVPESDLTQILLEVV